MVGSENNTGTGSSGATHYKVNSIPGGSFCLDVPAGVPAVWGEDSQVLWAEGEPLLLVGASGVGKTTIGQQLVLGMLGLRDEVLGLPVKQADRVLYFAIDRWRQAQRSFHRMVNAADRDVLDKRLIVVKGSLPRMLNDDPRVLAAIAKKFGAGAVFIDSLKDAARKLSDDNTGSAVAEAFRYCEDIGVEAMANHHQRKAGKDTGPSVALDDVYGNQQITAAAGSVVLLVGKAGDLLVKLKHLKQPAEEVGPWEVMHDHPNGVSTRLLSVDLAILAGSNGGLTVKAAASALFSTDKPTPNEVEKARRRLEMFVSKQTMVKDTTVTPVVYRPMTIDLTDGWEEG